MKKSVITIIAILACLGACVAIGNNDNNSEKKEEASDTTLTSEKAETKSDWKYSEETDEMTDKIAYFATVQSENEVEFDFPYQGGSTLSFTLRDSPEFGKDAYIRISKGQFNVQYNGTKIKIRFDDKEPITVTANEASDGSMDILFLRNYAKLVNALKEAKTMKINVEFFNEGIRTFTFDVANLKWEH